MGLAFALPFCHYHGVLLTERPAMVPPLSAGNREAVTVLLPDQERGSPYFPVVCIGGSAGSLPAYIDILTQLPKSSGLAIVIVSHRAIANSNLLLEILAKATGMEVVEAADGMLLRVARIFVAPPHRELTTDGVVLKLASGATGHNGWPTLISNFIISMADRCGSRGIAIIVSGMGHDGSSALRAVKKAGGWTFAQSDAEYIDMPQAAIDTNNVDFILRADQIGKHLASLITHLRHVAN
jgi:two-component system, chemotaxis family, CheB/CheR fusion protein